MDVPPIWEFYELHCRKRFLRLRTSGLRTIVPPTPRDEMCRRVDYMRLRCKARTFIIYDCGSCCGVVSYHPITSSQCFTGLDRGWHNLDAEVSANVYRKRVPILGILTFLRLGRASTVIISPHRYVHQRCEMLDAARRARDFYPLFIRMV
jgi:hypothetical protein